LFFLLFLSLLPPLVFAAQIRIAWDPNTEPDLAGYRLYYGTASGTYEEPIDTGNVTTYTLAGLTLGQTYFISVTALDTSNNESGYSNEVNGPATDGVSPTIAMSSPLPLGAVGSAYIQTLTATGGTTPYSWSVVSGSLPAGLTLTSATGVISGTSTMANTFTFRIRVTGANSLYSEKDFSLTINPAPTAPTIATSSPLPAGTVSTAYSQTLTATGGTTPYTWSVVSGSLPAGLTLASGTGVISGTPTTANTYTFRVRVTGANSLYSEKNLSLTINPAPTAPTIATSSPLPGGTAGMAYGQTFTATSGTPPYSWSVVSGSLPAGLTLASSTGIISGTPTTPNTFSFRIRVAGANSLYSEKNFRLTINVQNNFPISCSDGGIQCIERADGGSDSNNLVNGKPKVDVEYIFQITVQDAGGTPQYARVFTAQRNNPSASDFYAYDMACIGNYPTGANCTYQTMLGPAAIHKFYFKVKQSNGSEINYPSTGYIAGPQIQLMNGNNLVGAPRNISSAQLSGQQAFNNSRVYRWDPEQNSYVKVTSSNPVKEGEGYSLYRKNKTLPELNVYPDVPGLEYTYPLKTGLNLVSNPYSGNVKIFDLKIQKGTGTPVSWQEGVARGWIVDAIYYYNGQEWGDTYSYLTSETGGVLVPWIGYWVDLDAGDDLYYLVIARP